MPRHVSSPPTLVVTAGRIRMPLDRGMRPCAASHFTNGICKDCLGFLLRQTRILRDLCSDRGGHALRTGA